MSNLSAGYVRSFFKEYLVKTGYKEKTIKCRMMYLKTFTRFLEEKANINDFRNVDRQDILNFLDYLERLECKRKKQLLAKLTKSSIFGVVRQLFKTMQLKELILLDPTLGIHYRPSGTVRQKEIMTKEEIGWFLDRLTERRPLGVRDRAMFELLYSTGLRAGELVGLNVEDINFDERLLLVRKGKWEKDRVVPLSDVSIKFLRLYLAGRKVNRKSALFVSSQGVEKRFRMKGINLRFQTLLKVMGMYRKGLTVHSIRHSVAVHLLSNGADIRYVQELLGHNSIETTVIYTNELSENIRKIYCRYHPRENEFKKELDEEYLERLEVFYQRLNKQKKIREKDRETKKRYIARKKAMQREKT